MTQAHASRHALAVLPTAFGLAVGLAGCTDAGTGYGGGSTDPAASAAAPDATFATVPLDGGGGTLADPVSPDGTFSDASSPFAIPDPTAASLLGRYGYPALLASADALASERWLEVYTDFADTLPELLGGEEAPRVAESFDCPAGGTADIARANAGAPGQPDAYAYRFADCTVDGVTLAGELVQIDGIAGTRFSTSRSRTSRFDGLVLLASDGSRTELDGEIERTRTALSVPDCAGEAGSSTELEIDMDSALIEQRDALPVTLAAVRYRSLDERGLSDRGDCTAGERLTFDGGANARLTEANGVEIDLTLERRGSIERPSTPNAVASGDALLTVTAVDGSRLAVTTTDLANDGARIDLTDGAVTTSIETVFRFER